MGVDILWLMPIHPIGQVHRKGSLGSAYSVADYLAVNPDHGTFEDFKRLVASAHARGMNVIIDWVANHTAWDHPWVAQHPDWYKRDAAGKIHACVFDNGRELEHWTDVVGLDYRQPALWDAMIEAMAFWVREAGIDGFRCDVAGLVPTAFWNRARAELDRIKPVFMLAEWSAPELHAQAFDMTYDWTLYELMKGLAAGTSKPAELARWVEQLPHGFPADAYRMLFTSNHDKNSWEGSDAELYGASFKAFAVLAATLPGMPLVYGGQEAVLGKRLAFFEKDAIDWKSLDLASFYAGLLALKHSHPALRNGAAGGAVEVVDTGNDQVFAFRRRLDGDAVEVAVNLSAVEQAVAAGPLGAALDLAPWGFHIGE
jgi:glycosidase